MIFVLSTGAMIRTYIPRRSSRKTVKNSPHAPVLPAHTLHIHCTQEAEPRTKKSTLLPEKVQTLPVSVPEEEEHSSSRDKGTGARGTIEGLT